ncbi:MAG: hypothetical protein QM767_21955 [Anaeromyxobacter sp.]
MNAAIPLTLLLLGGWPAPAPRTPTAREVASRVAAEPPPLRAPATAPPLDCPPGTARQGNAPPDGFEEYCERLDELGRELKQGPARTFYDDGLLWTETTWEKNKRSGPYTEFHRGGARAIQGTYLADGKEGTWTIWFPDGKIEERSSWRNNTPDGPFVSFWPGGLPKVVGRHCLGAQCGRWTTFDQDGKEVGVVDYGELRDKP